MFGGFGSLPKGSGKGKTHAEKQPEVIKGRLEGGSTKGSPEVTIRVKPGVAGPGAPVLGRVDARVTPETVGGKADQKPTAYIVRTGKESVYRYWNSRKDFELAKIEGRVGIRWVGPIFDESGYGEACRNYVAALVRSGFPVSAKAISFGEPSTDYGMPGKVTKSVLDLGVTSAINLVYSPPHFFDDHRDPRAYNIGMFVWEMSGLPGEWVNYCNRMNEVWVPCEWNARAAIQSGVKVPVFVFGHTVAPEEYEGVAPLSIPNLDPNLYKFYSIFQWSSRKNPQALLKAYLMAFTSKDPVILIMKTYGQNYSGTEEKKVKAEVDAIRKQVGGSQPKVLLITKMLSKGQVLGLHNYGDCFYLPHRAEGWGLPHFEACMSGKPVITTNYGGNLEFTKPEHSYLVESRQVPVRGMEWFKWFTPEMTWAEADLNGCISALRKVFGDKQEAARRGALARDYVSKAFNWTSIGEAIKRRLQEIVKVL